MENKSYILITGRRLTAVDNCRTQICKLKDAQCKTTKLGHVSESEFVLNTHTRLKCLILQAIHHFVTGFYKAFMNVFIF